MADFPGFPCNNFDFHFEEVGPALGGLIIKDRTGVPRAGILSSREDLVRKRNDWGLDFSSFVAVRVKDKAVLIGGTTDAGILPVSPAPSANARLDVIWTRPADVNDGEEVVALQITTGVPAAVPTKPAIPEGAIEVGTFRISAGAANAQAGVLTLTFPYTCTAGGIIRFRSTEDRTSFLPVPGQVGIVANTLWVSNDGTWERAVPLSNEIWAGTLATRELNAGESRKVPQSFPAGTFSGTPIVIVTPWGGNDKFSTSVGGINSGGCTITLNNHGTSKRSVGAQIIAIRLV